MSYAFSDLTGIDMCEQTDHVDLPEDVREPCVAARFAAHDLEPEVEAPGVWTKQRRTTGRRKLWELPHKYHCPVIGTCLHVDELRRLARKRGCKPKHALSDYEVHVSFVAAANEKNSLSFELQRLLERKYAGAVKRFARAKTADELERLWDEALANGEVKGAFWAIMSHPLAPAEMCMLAYADVHMLSHQIGAGQVADLKALTDARRVLADLQRDIRAERQSNARKLSERDQRIECLEQRVRELTEVEQDLLAAREQVARLESDTVLQALITREQTLADRLKTISRRADDARSEAQGLRERAAIAEQRRDALSAELADREQIIRSLERMLLPAHDTTSCCEGDCGQCASPDAAIGGVDLRGRRILCVGGRGSLNAHYRSLVQRCNGELIRHDGGLEDSRKRLEALLASADAVICPADCVSHDAYLRTKRFCKHNNKPCVLIERSGIGAFANALSLLAPAHDPTPRPSAFGEPTPQPA